MVRIVIKCFLWSRLWLFTGVSCVISGDEGREESVCLDCFGQKSVSSDRATPVLVLFRLREEQKKKTEFWQNKRSTFLGRELRLCRQIYIYKSILFKLEGLELWNVFLVGSGSRKRPCDLSTKKLGDVPTFSSVYNLKF